MALQGDRNARPKSFRGTTKTTDPGCGIPGGGGAGLDGLTGRDVAQAAGLSSGLVFFHYGSIEALRLALLDELIGWLVGSDEGAAVRGPGADFMALMAEEIGLQQTDHEKVGLFLQYWVLGMRFPEMRARLRQALDDYRALFHEPARELLIARAASNPRNRRSRRWLPWP